MQEYSYFLAGAIYTRLMKKYIYDSSYTRECRRKGVMYSHNETPKSSAISCDREPGTLPICTNFVCNACNVLHSHEFSSSFHFAPHQFHRPVSYFHHSKIAWSGKFYNAWRRL